MPSWQPLRFLTELLQMGEEISNKSTNSNGHARQVLSSAGYSNHGINLGGVSEILR
jgi:hypothetical protein